MTPDINDLMKMAQDAQNKILEAQKKLDQIMVEGAAGGGMVKVQATARGRVTRVSIDDSLIAGGDKQMLEDLVAAAFNDARGKAEAAGNQAMNEAAGGLMPPGFQMPPL
jgi:nucleoid-associated protein EbfC